MPLGSHLANADDAQDHSNSDALKIPPLIPVTSPPPTSPRT